MLTLIRIGDTKVTEYPGSYIEKGKKFDAEILFSVPKGAQNLQLIILGSPPVEIK